MVSTIALSDLILLARSAAAAATSSAPAERLSYRDLVVVAVMTEPAGSRSRTTGSTCTTPGSARAGCRILRGLEPCNITLPGHHVPRSRVLLLPRGDEIRAMPEDEAIV